MATEWQERAVPEIGRRASDRMLMEVSESVARLETKVDRIGEDYKLMRMFVERYSEKSETTGDPHRWIQNVGAPTARDFNKLKTMIITCGAVIAIIWGVVKVALPALLKL